VFKNRKTVVKRRMSNNQKPSQRDSGMNDRLLTELLHAGLAQPVLQHIKRAL